MWGADLSCASSNMIRMAMCEWPGQVTWPGGIERAEWGQALPSSTSPPCSACPTLASCRRPGYLRHYVVLKHHCWCKVDAISMSEAMLFDAMPLIDQPVQTVRILDHPCAILPTNLRMHTRNTQRRHQYITA